MAVNEETPTDPAAHGGRSTVLGGVIAWCARNWLLTLMVVGVAAGWGVYALTHIPLDAIPDLSDVQVIVYTEWPGQSPDLVEDQITYPLTTILLSVPGVKAVRGQSVMGASFVYVIFEDGTDLYWARSRVLTALSTVGDKLPAGVQPVLGPDATAVGWVYQYAVVDRTGAHNLAELRAIQDFRIRYALASVEGVSEVASVGGFVKEYHVYVDPNKLAAFDITLEKVMAAVREANGAVGGGVLAITGHEYFIRARGYIDSTEDLAKVVLGADEDGVPINLDQVATISLGPAPMRGQADLNGQGVTVGGIVVMRQGANALAVIGRVKQRLRELEASLPRSVDIIPVYDRSKLIERAIDTLTHTLIEEAIVVSLVIFVFLLHLRSALVAVITLPVAILLAFVPMYYQGLTADIMSLGGIAVAIGAMVDAAIAMIENVHRRLSLWQAGEGPPRDSGRSRTAIVIDAMQEVGPSIFFALLIITVSFVPVFALQGPAGRLFEPLAFTKTYAMFFAALLSVTLIPALAVLVIRGKIRGHRNWLNRVLVAAYTPLVRGAVRFRWAVVVLALLALVSIWPAYQSLGREFMPPLNEGTILYMPVTLPGMSIAEATQTLQTMDRLLSRFPEVKRVFGKVGRATTPTDSAPLSMFEIVVMLKPKRQWREGMTWDELIAAMDAKLQFPGISNLWWMPIQTRTQMLATGIRSSLGIKVYGPDLGTIGEIATTIEQALATDPRTAGYTRSVFAERTSGGFFLDIDIHRGQAARYGLNVGDVQAVIAAAMGGKVVAQTVNGRERFNIRVQYAPPFQDDLTSLKQTLIATPGGAQIPLSQIADLEFNTGPAMIRSEDGQLVSFVYVGVGEGIGIPDYVAKAKQVVADKVEIPTGYRIAWAGQFKNYQRAKARLQILIPLTLFLIFFMLYFHRRSLMETAIVMLGLPFSLVGGLWLLVWLEYKLSVAVAVGMIAVAGLAVELALLMMLYLDMAWRGAGQPASGTELTEAIVDGAARRLRPKLMTGAALVAGLLPILFASGAGADVMKRIAAPMLGGVVSSLILVLIVFPAVYAFRRGRHR